MKVITFYLPQFHTIPENDAWWGQGFTEWTNVKRGKSMYPGHFQPRVPADLGYYDLRSSDTQIKQTELAKEYSIYGFCYYYYWFSGKKLLDTPLNAILNSKKPDFPFCICFANENWTRRWDGCENEVLIRQEHSLENDKRFIREVLPILSDRRYIHVNGKPLLLLYRAELLQNSIETAELWQSEAKKYGLAGLYLCSCQSFSQSNGIAEGFDAAVEFPPHGLWMKKIDLHGVDPDFSGRIMDYESSANLIMNREWPSFKLHKTAMLGWDNTARRKSGSYIYHNFSLEAYEKWLRTIIARTAKKYPSDERLVFINAWNEWSEGTYLEPDTRYGFQYLESTKKAIRDGLAMQYDTSGIFSKIKSFFNT